MPKVELQNLEGFQVSENRSARLIEESLGIKFPKIVPVVKLSFRNKIQRAKNAGVSGAIAEAIEIRKDTRGMYDREYDAIFVAKDSGLFVELHENGHVFLDNINPEIYNKIEEMVIMLDQRKTGQAVDTEQVETIVTYRCFDEGIAQWIALETAERLPEDFELNDIQDLKNVLLQNSIQKIRDVALIHKNLLSLTGTRVMIESLKANARLGLSKYTTGYTFVYGVMRSIDSPSDQVGKVLTKLIENPPKSIDDLENPQKFAQKISQEYFLSSFNE